MDTHGIRDLATRAHSGTSFVPERRGEQAANEVAGELAEMRAWIAERAPAEMVAELFDEYRAGYLARTRRWLEAKSRTLSPMITGPARFPTARNEKRLDTEHKRLGELLTYQQRSRVRIMRRIRRATLPDDPGAAVRAEIEQKTRTLEAMKAANKIIRRKLTDPEKVQAIVTELGFKESTAWKILKPDFAGRVGFPGYELTSINGKIKRLQEKLRVIEVSQAPEREPVKGEGWEIVEDPREDRLRIHFDAIPPAELREKLKRHGFRWSPTAGAWQRQLTQRARIDAEHILAGITAAVGAV